MAFLAVYLTHGVFEQLPDAGEIQLALADGLKQFGYLGVDFFFVLSGFLLTYLAVNRRRETGDFKLGKFYLKRAVRVLPLYFLVLLLAWAGDQVIGSELNPDHWPKSPFWAYGTLTLNYFMEYESVHFWFWLTFMWTICVEVHYYVLLGLIYKFCHKYMEQIFVGMILFGLIYKVAWVVVKDQPLFFDSLNYLPHFGVGGWLGCAMASDKPLFNTSGWVYKYRWLLTGVATIALATHMEWRSIRWFYMFDNLVYIIFFGLILLWAIRWDSMFQLLLVRKRFIFLGKISFGLYVFHGGVITLWTSWAYQYLPMPWWIATVFVFQLTIALAVASHRLIERPLIKWASN